MVVLRRNKLCRHFICNSHKGYASHFNLHSLTPLNVFLMCLYQFNFLMCIYESGIIWDFICKASGFHHNNEKNTHQVKALFPKKISKKIKGIGRGSTLIFTSWSYFIEFYLIICRVFLIKKKKIIKKNHLLFLFFFHLKILFFNIFKIATFKVF